MKAMVPFIYHNVLLAAFAQTEAECYALSCYEKSIESEDDFTLRSFGCWCKEHGIQYEAQFYWRKDYPLSANIWNGATYLIWRAESFLRRC